MPSSAGKVPTIEPGATSALRRAGQLRLRARAAAVSFAVGLGMLGLKLTAWIVTGSAAVLSDALESVVHVAAVAFMFWASRFAAAPPDADHPYGHGRAEHLSVGFEGGAIAFAGLAIAWQAIDGLVRGQAPHALDIGLVLTGAAAGINLGLGLWLRRVAERTGSALLRADAQHVLSDVWTSVGVLAGVGVMLLLPAGPARAWCDGLVALALAAVILVVGAQLLREAASALLDAADPALLGDVVRYLDELRDADWRDLHNLRVRSVGDAVHIDFHLVVPGAWNVVRAHAAVETLERHLLARLDRPGTVMIHLDHPSDDALPGILPPGPIALAHATRMVSDG